MMQQGRHDDAFASIGATYASMAHYAQITGSTHSVYRNATRDRVGPIEPQPSCTKNLLKIGRVVPEIGSRTDTQTHKITDKLITI